MQCPSVTGDPLTHPALTRVTIDPSCFAFQVACARIQLASSAQHNLCFSASFLVHMLQLVSSCLDAGACQVESVSCCRKHMACKRSTSCSMRADCCGCLQSCVCTGAYRLHFDDGGVAFCKYIPPPRWRIMVPLFTLGAVLIAIAGRYTANLAVHSGGQALYTLGPDKSSPPGMCS